MSGFCVHAEQDELLDMPSDSMGLCDKVPYVTISDDRCACQRYMLLLLETHAKRFNVPLRQGVPAHPWGTDEASQEGGALLCNACIATRTTA